MASSSKRQLIRDTFEAMGKASIRRLVDRLVESGFYQEETVRGFAMKGMMSDARNALREKGVRGCVPGLRHSYPVPSGLISADDDDASDIAEGGPEWQLLSLFAQDQLFLLINRTSQATAADHAALVLLRNYCRERFGVAPEIVEIMEPV